jgi:ABC-type cobalamin/Fe3+-siderophores transport system ATPase subunit
MHFWRYFVILILPLLLDEPTNYLDREALGALTQAIKGFQGGVVIISHNAEFTDALCSENWIVNAGACVVEGEVYIYMYIYIYLYVYIYIYIYVYIYIYIYIYIYLYIYI